MVRSLFFYSIEGYCLANGVRWGDGIIIGCQSADAVVRSAPTADDTISSPEGSLALSIYFFKQIINNLVKGFCIYE